MYGKEANFINHFITVYPANLQSKKNRKNIVHPFFVVFFLFVILFWCGIIMCGSYFEWELNQLAIEAQPSKQSSSSSLFQQQHMNTPTAIAL